MRSMPAGRKPGTVFDSRHALKQIMSVRSRIIQLHYYFSLVTCHLLLVAAVLVPMVGLEPTCLAAPPPQDGVSTNFTTSAIAQTPASFQLEADSSDNCQFSGIAGMSEPVSDDAGMAGASTGSGILTGPSGTVTVVSCCIKLVVCVARCVAI